MLKVEDLSVTYYNINREQKAISNINFQIEKGEIVGMVGESGSGKSTIANAILKSLPSQSKIEGKILWNNKEINETNIHKLRGKKIAYISQNFFLSLNNKFTIFTQFNFLLKSNHSILLKARKEKIISTLKALDFHNPREILNKYPFQLSGGMVQRIVIAMAVACNPDLLIADEPTSSIDTISKVKFISILNKININSGMSILLISHDLPIIQDVVNKIIVVYKGIIVEQGPANIIIKKPEHPYTDLLLNSKPNFKSKTLKEKIVYNQHSSYCLYSNYCKYYSNECNRPFDGIWQDNRYIKCIRCQNVKN